MTYWKFCGHSSQHFWADCWRCVHLESGTAQHDVAKDSQLCHSHGRRFRCAAFAYLTDSDCQAICKTQCRQWQHWVLLIAILPQPWMRQWCISPGLRKTRDLGYHHHHRSKYHLIWEHSSSKMSCPAARIPIRYREAIRYSTMPCECNFNGLLKNYVITLGAIWISWYGYTSKWHVITIASCCPPCLSRRPGDIVFANWLCQMPDKLPFYDEKWLK